MSKRPPRPVARIYLRKFLDNAKVEDIRTYVERFGRGEARIRRIDREVLLYVYDAEDFRLVRTQLGDMVDAWVDLRR